MYTLPFHFSTISQNIHNFQNLQLHILCYNSIHQKHKGDLLMAYQTVFKRYEFKYILTQDQKNDILQAMAPYMVPDQYGKTTIRNLYFDTENYRLIRHSIEKPIYKEKLRLRSYQRTSPESEVFVELKKKFQSVVYKRRISMTQQRALQWLCGNEPLSAKTQISSEIDYFVSYYGDLQPTVFLSYDREAYYAKDDSQFRVTFDERILCRQTDLSLEHDAYGTPILDEQLVLMEIKCIGGIPLWMTQMLSKQKLYKTTFSKYGTAYQTLIYPKLKEDYFYGNIV